VDRRRDARHTKKEAFRDISLKKVARVWFFYWSAIEIIKYCVVTHVLKKKKCISVLQKSIEFDFIDLYPEIIKYCCVT
jgi:hypothetical protein